MALFHTYTEVKYGDENIKIVEVQAYVLSDRWGSRVGSVCVFNPADLGSLRQAGHSSSVGQIGRALHDHHLPWHTIGFGILCYTLVN